MSWSDWLSVERVAVVYDMAPSSVYKLKGKGGIRWANVPGLGLRFYKPDIDRYIESCVSALAQKLHQQATGG